MPHGAPARGAEKGSLKPMRQVGPELGAQRTRGEERNEGQNIKRVSESEGKATGPER